MAREQTDEQREAAVMARGLAKAAALLSAQYHWVITNVPYLGSRDQCEKLVDFCKKACPAGKSDLAAVLLDRCLEFCNDSGTTSIVLPQNWLFLTSYRKFREKLLRAHTWHLLARLGPGAFETISGEVVKAILLNISRGSTARSEEGLFGSGAEATLIRGVDVSAIRTPAEKAAALISADLKASYQIGRASCRERV
jgi:hypothetical protein